MRVEMFCLYARLSNFLSFQMLLLHRSIEYHASNWLLRDISIYNFERFLIIVEKIVKSARKAPSGESV